MIESNINLTKMHAVFNRLISWFQSKENENAVGKQLLHNTLTRYDREVDPDFKPWLRNSVYTRKIKKSSRVLVNTGALRNSITYKIEPDKSITIMSLVAYAKSMQEGLGDRSGTWGNAPARPFIGFSSVDKEQITDLLKHGITSRVSNTFTEMFKW